MWPFKSKPAVVNVTCNFSGEELVKKADLRIRELLEDNNAKLQTIRDQKALIEQLAATVGANHRWHKDYDDVDGYPDSELELINTKAIAAAASTRASA
jgi:hypothetical protein